MILYTPLAASDIFPCEETSRSECIQSGGKSVLARKLEDGSYEVEQLLSTDPQDFLNQTFAPGQIIQQAQEQGNML